MVKLNIGCGNDYKKGYINIDISPAVKTDVLIKSEGEIAERFKGVDEIYCSKTFPYFKDQHKILIDWWYILRVGGIIKIIVPHFSSPPYEFVAYRHIGYATREFKMFEYNKNWHRIPEEVDYKVKPKIKLYKGLQFWNYLLELLININTRTQGIYETTCLHSLFPAQFLEVEMVKNG